MGNWLDSYSPFLSRPVDSVRQDLDILIEILTKWQRVQNLVSRETAEIEDRHLRDSLQLLPLIGEATHPGVSVNWLDLGSGGGFPALPLAIALKAQPFTYHLVEANGRKCAFLNAVKRALDLPITVQNVRIEALEPSKIGPVTLITSRALAPLPLLMRYMTPFWGPSTRALLHKGREFGEECEQADSLFSYDVVNHPSQVDTEGVILDIMRLNARTR